MAVMSFREPNEVLWRGVRPGHKGVQGGWDLITNDTGFNNLMPAHATLTTFITYFYMTIGDNAAVVARLIERTSAPANFFTLAIMFGNEGYPGKVIVSNFSPPLEIIPTHTIDLELSLAVWSFASVMGWRE